MGYALRPSEYEIGPQFIPFENSKAKKALFGLIYCRAEPNSIYSM
jgi:hypothetical protein